MEQGFLIDTHVWLWWRTAPDRLSRQACEILEADESKLWFSVASAWEIAIKCGIGKLRLPEPAERFVPRALLQDDIRPLAVDLHHVLATARLPLHHRDPFDRILVAQACTENLTLISADPVFARYEVPLLPAAAV